MVTKVLFVGNILSGDDGIAPIIYQKIKDDKRLAGLELIEAGIMGVTLVPNAEGADHAIFVDAIKAPTTPGTVTVIDAENVQELIGITSAHDVGVEQIVVMIKTLSPQTKISIIGIVVEQTNAFVEVLSKEIEEKLDTIAKDVIKNILLLVGETRA